MTGAKEHPHRRRHVIETLAVVGVVVVFGGATFAVMWMNSGAEPVSQKTAVSKYRASTSAPGTTVHVPLRPEPGVYQYRGTGTESISVPPKSQDQGPDMPGTVRWLDDDCWSFRIDHSTNHWRTWTYCPRDSDLVETGGQVYERWDFVVTKVDNLSTMVCEPPSLVLRDGLHPGTTWDQHCHGTNSDIEGEVYASGPYRYIGAETFTIGGVELHAHHFRMEHALSGAQEGNEVSDLWFDTDNGLPLKNVRHIEVRSDSPIGKVTYTEDGSFELAAPAPQR